MPVEFLRKARLAARSIVYVETDSPAIVSITKSLRQESIDTRMSELRTTMVERGYPIAEELQELGDLYGKSVINRSSTSNTPERTLYLFGRRIGNNK